ncbi:hypothetical protein ABBQ32_005064 [Trebouxia sp. C0010 RCD-2024]
MDPKQQKALLQSVRSSLLTVQELEQTVSNFSGDQVLLDTQLNALVASLKDLQSKQTLCGGSEVPIEVLRALDIGGNPDISTLDLFKQGLQENQATKGKVQALQQLREDLDKELRQAYPAAFTAYSALKATPASPAPTE